ncbi:MAG: DegT/DnrJ/EryC1/StrS aminotransferase [Parcubacteria group bacterium Gr01-1014_48]|nr:MAG: DegT/DnrJ/EryC1/StrS aminotransferase [Parcubacteria group bacterium Greene0416_14]TSC74475.1 MAG: DegT/DnrJ/EryC1/StrS aminotransferase [Parcubacteria group bacterium Gr01-1014_48]TSD01786.1 MAG: DegT/DnrJ/EryC1/StrS aminotransferase [Parcubacteria group bacterium Greene1014_15]TSD08500.1 MAG: DegT/DnrJ/EryC1/StrS aminotransferase [Parcubacteria group bacterium Greene0714_4]
MKVPPVQPYFFETDIRWILARFRGILQGKSFFSTHIYTEEFEKKFAAYIGVKYAVGCNSGTSALELICRAIDVAGKEVILPSNTFIATANAILNAGGKPVFADCGDDMCMDAPDAISRVTKNTAAIMHVHIGGIVSPSIVKLRDFCEKRGIHLLEDAAQAHGSSLGGIKAGAFGTAAGFSFFSTKVMTTGEGGMVTTNDVTLVSKMKSMREFGKEKKDIYINHHTSIGYNWRMPEVAALMGLRQLKALPLFLKRRREIAVLYDKLLRGHPDIQIVKPTGARTHNYFKYMIILSNHDRARVHKALQKEGIGPSGYVYEIPLHKQPVFPSMHGLSLPKTEHYSARHLCLPIFYGMKNKQVEVVVSTLKKILSRDT